MTGLEGEGEADGIEAQQLDSVQYDAKVLGQRCRPLPQASHLAHAQHPLTQAHANSGYPNPAAGLAQCRGTLPQEGPFGLPAQTAQLLGCSCPGAQPKSAF